MSLTLALLPLALPHAGAPLESIDVRLAPGEAGALGVEASVGWLWSADGQSFEWICHEAITAPGVLRVPRYALTAGGVMLGRVAEPEDGREAGRGLYRSEDGCDWASAEGLDGRALAALATHPQRAGAAWVATADPGLNEVLGSLDDGRSFAPAGLSAEAAFTSLVVGADGALWAAAEALDGAARLWWSADGWTGWTELPLPSGARPTLLAAGEGVAWVALGEVSDQRLLRVPADGAPPEEAVPGGRALTDMALEPGGAVWLAAGGAGYERSEDGLTFTPVEALPGLGLDIGRGQVWLAPRFEITRVSLAVGDPTQGFEPRFSLYELDGPPARCGPETHVGATCPADWETLAPRLFGLEDTGLAPDDSPADTGSPAEPGACGGCAGGASPAALAPLWLVAWRVRRRRA